MGLLTLAGVIDVQVGFDGKLTMTKVRKEVGKRPPGRLRRINLYSSTDRFQPYSIVQAEPLEAGIGWYSPWRIEIKHLISGTSENRQLITILIYLDDEGAGEARTLLSNTPEQQQRLITRTIEDMLAAHNRGQE